MQAAKSVALMVETRQLSTKRVEQASTKALISRFRCFGRIYIRGNLYLAEASRMRKSEHERDHHHGGWYDVCRILR